MPEKPQPHELDGKFRECAGFVLDDAKAEEVLRLIRGLEGVSDVWDLSGLLG